MKTSTLFATVAVSLVASTAAMADGAEYQYPQAFSTHTTRAEVTAQLQQARADGTLVATEADTQKNPVFVASRSRADVRTETLAAIASGEVQALNSNSNAFDPQFHRSSRVPALLAAK